MHLLIACCLQINISGCFEEHTAPRLTLLCASHRFKPTIPALSLFPYVTTGLAVHWIVCKSIDPSSSLLYVHKISACGLDLRHNCGLERGWWLNSVQESWPAGARMSLKVCGGGNNFLPSNMQLCPNIPTHFTCFSRFLWGYLAPCKYLAAGSDLVTWMKSLQRKTGSPAHSFLVKHLQHQDWLLKEKLQFCSKDLQGSSRGESKYHPKAQSAAQSKF